MDKKIMIPLELKYDFAIRAYISIHKGYLYAIREECGAATALKVYERLCKMEDRIKNLTATFLAAFKIEGNDAEAWAKWWDIWYELCGYEYTWLERSKTIARVKVTKSPFKTSYKDLSDWVLPFVDIVCKTINPKAKWERPKAMCAGDPYGEYVFKTEE